MLEILWTKHHEIEMNSEVETLKSELSVLMETWKRRALQAEQGSHTKGRKSHRFGVQRNLHFLRLRHSMGERARGKTGKI